MHFNPHTISAIFCLILAITCGAFVILKNPKAKLNRLFLAQCITFIAWFSYYIPFNFNCTDKFLLTWFRISFSLVSFIPITWYTFITTYLKIPKNNFWFKINSSIGISFSILSFTTPWIIQGIFHYPWYPYPRAGIIHPLLVLHCLTLAYLGTKLLIDSLKNPSLSDQQRNHIKYMLSAGIALISAALDFTGNYGLKFYEIGPFSVSVYLIITTTAIIRHQLMDIQIVIRKSLVYSTLVTLITLIFLILVLITETLSQHLIGYQNLVNSIILSVIVALIFIPLKNKIQCIIDRLFFKGTQLEIIQQNEKLRQEIIQTEKFKAVAALASSLVHEIRNPLTAINTFTEYIPQKKNDPKFLEQFAQTVPTEINRINNLMQELLNFAKPSEPKFESIDPKLLIENLIKLLSPQITKANIKVEIDSDDSPVSIQADPSQLKQALMNIIINAIHAMPDGGILSIKTSVIARNDVTKQSFIIEISDTGCGIAPKDLPHIFDPFFTKKEKGTGLGLAITQGIIEKHNGTIKVESKINQGTIFTIKLRTN